MKITIYELLGLVKDGKAPKKIKFRNEIYEYKNNIEDGFIDYAGIEKETNERFYLSSYIGNNYISDIFTDEVEIIEEPKEIKYPILHKTAPSETTGDEMSNWRYLIDYNFEYLNKTICQLIDEINNLKENG